MEENSIKYSFICEDAQWSMNSISFKCCVRIHSHLACTLTMCYVLITMICFLFFCHYIDYLFVSVFFFCCVCDLFFWQPFFSFFFSCTSAWNVHVRACVYMFVYCFTTPSMHPPTSREPGGVCRRWSCGGGRGHPRDQCNGRERWSNAQRGLPAATPRWPFPDRRRHDGCHLWGQHGPPRSWLQHTSGGQEAEVCEANGGEWGVWVSLHREEPVLRSYPSFPLPHSWGNLGNQLWGRGLKKLHDLFFFPFPPLCTCLRWVLPSSHCAAPLICLLSIIHFYSLLCG